MSQHPPRINRQECLRSMQETTEKCRRAEAEQRRLRKEWDAKHGITRKPRTRRPTPRVDPKKVKPLAFYVPINFDPAAFDFAPDEVKYAHYFLNQIHWRTCCRRDDEDGFVHLKAEYLRRLMPPKLARKVVSNLCANVYEGGPVVECDGTAECGRKAWGYRLTPAYRKTHRVVCTDQKLALKVWSHYADDDARLLTVHHWLRGHLDRLKFDLERALGIVATMRPRPDSPMTIDEYRAAQVYRCERLAGGDHYLTRDAYGRVHTPVTSHHRELRCCLQVGREPLVGWDLKNSQPLIAGLIARQFCRSKDARYRLGKATFTDDGNPYAYESLDQMVDRDDLPEDVVEYVRCCERGDFYESFMKLGDDRERVKKGFLSILMGPNKYRSPAKAAFSAKYPTVAEMFEHLKRKEPARAAWLLQNREATIFIYGVCRRIMADRPEAPVYTVHDSIFTTPGHAEYVRDVILDEFSRFGVRPKLEKKR